MENFQISEESKAITRAVIKKALEDPSFKERLIKNPLECYREVYPDFDRINESREIVVNDQTDFSKVHINVSYASYVLYGGDIEDIELSEEELEMVAGGASCVTISCFAPH